LQGKLIGRAPILFGFAAEAREGQCQHQVYFRVSGYRIRRPGANQGVNFRIGIYTIAKVGKDRKPIKETEEYISCDTLLLSVGLIPENELSRKAGIPLSSVTGGAIVDNSLETSIDGIFACGNVLHVHDLVDNVTLESYDAGRNAAKYINCLSCKAASISLNAIEGVRYTIPQFIDPGLVDKELFVRFRVGDVFKDAYISVYFDDKRVIRRKKRILTPGEMEEIKLTDAMFKEHSGVKTITFKVERS
jgi:hypothetical protein